MSSSSHPNSNGSSDTAIASTALAIALIALITTVGQLLQQYLGTADGYRRCQHSVMGPWANLTRLRWRWGQFRFETLFTTPNIGIGTFPDDSRERFLTGSRKSFAASMIPDKDEELEFAGGEMASWVPFLYSAHRHHALVMQVLGFGRMEPTSQDLWGKTDIVMHESQKGRLLNLPYVTLENRSWDFISPEVVRPYARISVHAVAVMARRMGMIWKTFDPPNGIMRAEGNGYYITSTTLRSIGTLLHFSSYKAYLGPDQEDEGAPIMPNKFADSMGFGVLPCTYWVGNTDFCMGTEADVIDVITNISSGNECLSKFRNLIALSPSRSWIPGFSELIPLAAPMIGLKQSVPAMAVPAPSEWSFGITSWPKALDALLHCLNEWLARDGGSTPIHSRSAQIRWIIDTINEQSILNSGARRYFQQVLPRQTENENTRRYLACCHDTWLATSGYFFDLQLNNKLGATFYRNLLYSHIAQIILHYEEEMQHVSLGELRGGKGEDERAVLGVYVRCLPFIVDDMKAKGVDDEDLVEEAWFTMMLRAWCWNQLHRLIPGRTVPKQYHGSALPVFIA